MDENNNQGDLNQGNEMNGNMYSGGMNNNVNNGGNNSMDNNMNNNNYDQGQSGYNNNYDQGQAGYNNNYDQGQSGYNTNMGYQQQNNDREPLTLGEWILTLIVAVIPCVNIVMLCVWAFGKGNINRKNYSKAMLIIMAVGIVLYIIFFAAMGATLFSAMGNAGSELY